MSWSARPLCEVADFALGKMLDQAKNKGDLLPYLANINVRWGEFDLNDLRVMRFESREIERFSLKHGDIVMCEGGEPGRCALWKEQQSSMMFQKALHRIRPTELLDSRFLYYSFLNLRKSSGFDPYFTGATIKHLPREQLAKVVVRFPDIKSQESIATILENLLEDAARRLYREWFVHLRYPGHELVTVKDGVPQGWYRSSVSAQTAFLNRGIAPIYDESVTSLIINQKCIRDGRLSLDPARHQSREVKPDRLIQIGDVLINSTGAGTLGRVAQIRQSIPDCTVDSHVTIARPIDPPSTTYFGQALLNLEPVFSAMGKGATNQLELSRSDIGAVEIWQPTVELMRDFHLLVWPMLEQAEQLCESNLLLKKSRDLLLPKLMSGQLDV